MNDLQSIQRRSLRRNPVAKMGVQTSLSDRIGLNSALVCLSYLPQYVTRVLGWLVSRPRPAGRLSDLRQVQW